MKKLISKIKYLAPLGLLAIPFLASAQACSNCVESGLMGTSGLQGLFGYTGLNSAQTLPQLIAEVITILLIFAGSIAVIFVIIGGYQYLTSAGNEEAAEKGKKTLINAIIGIVVVILSYLIINVIINLVGNGLY